MSQIHSSHTLSREAAGKCTQSKWENKARNGVLKGVREAPDELGVSDRLGCGAPTLPGGCSPGSRELQRVSAPRLPPGGARARASPPEGLGEVCRCGRLWPLLWHPLGEICFQWKLSNIYKSKRNRLMKRLIQFLLSLHLCPPPVYFEKQILDIPLFHLSWYKIRALKKKPQLQCHHYKREQT